MKITVDQGALLGELTLLQGIIEKKATLPILSNVQLTAHEDGRVAIVATDLEIGFRSSLRATVAEAGSTTVHARRLHDIVRRLPSGSIGFRLTEGQLHLWTERIRYKLATMDAEQFPSLRQREGEAGVTLEAAQLADMIKRVAFAISGEDPRYSIGGALWELSPESVKMVATDGHRLALSRRKPICGNSSVPRIVVPRKALVELQRLAQDHDGEVAIWPASNSLFGVFGEREVSSSLQEPNFPDYNRVIPSGNDKSFTIERELLKQAIERVAVLSQEHTHLVKLELEEGLLRLSATSPHLGDAQEEQAIDYAGSPFAIGFNAQYLLDFLAVAGTALVRVSLGQPMGQGLFEPVRTADPNAAQSAATEDLGGALMDQYIVMPMAL